MCGLRKFSIEHFHYSRAIRFAISALDFPHGLQTEYLDAELHKKHRKF